MKHFEDGAFERKPHFCAMKNLLIAVFLTMSLWACQENQKESQPREAVDTENVQPLSEVEKLTQQIRNNPKDADLYYQRSMANLKENMLLLAMDDINRALSADSVNADYHALKGEIHYLKKEPEQAVEQFERSLEIDPENTDALLKMSEIKLLLRQYQECFDFANRALRVDEQLYMAYFIKGYAHYELGDSNLFVSSVQTALELNPDFFDGYVMLGSFYASLDSDMALDYYNSALVLQPENAEALYGKAIYLQNRGRTDEAIELYEQMISIEDNSPLAWYNQGYIWLEMRDDPRQAISFFEKAQSLHPQYTEALYNLGLCYERLEKADSAEIFYRQALEIDPQYDMAALGMERLHD